MAFDPSVLSSLMEKCVGDCNRQVSDSHLEELSRTHCKDWRRIPPHLGLEGIMRDDIDRNGHDERGKRYDFFTGWKERKGADATYKALMTALLKIGSRNDAEYVCQLLQPASTGHTQTSSSVEGRANGCPSSGATSINLQQHIGGDTSSKQIGKPACLAVACTDYLVHQPL